MDKNIFVLGGNDGEMEVIKAILSLAGLDFYQPQKSWGNHAFGPDILGLEVIPSHTEGEFRRIVPDAVEGVRKAIFVECLPAVNWPAGTPVVAVDHHGDRSGEPASVLQVLVEMSFIAQTMRASAENCGAKEQHELNKKASQILEVLNFSGATRRWIELVASNDAGYIPAMVAIGATVEEIARVRTLERSCQSITAEQELAAEKALAAPAEFIGPYRVIHLAHSKCATVNDRLFRPGQPERTLILSGDGEVNVFGDGATCAELKKKFDGWDGGSGLGKAEGQAFWGGYSKHDELLAWMKERFAS